MSNLLLLYEIADKASRVTTRQAFHEFETWVKKTKEFAQDADLARTARIHLFRLKSQIT